MPLFNGLGLQPDEIGTVVMGNTVQAGNKMNPARQAAIHGGLPVQVPVMTVSRVCGSGAQAIVSAAHEILMGSVDTAMRSWSRSASRSRPTLFSQFAVGEKSKKRERCVASLRLSL
jgi:acetyl-CoA acetyltransferase